MMKERAGMKGLKLPGSVERPVECCFKSRPFASSKSEKEEILYQDLDRTACFSHRFAAVDILPRPIIQPKLIIGSPGDRYEQEADRVADQVMSTISLSDHVPVQRECSYCDGRSKEKDELWRKLAAIDLLNAGGRSNVEPHLANAIQQSRGKGRPLSDDIRHQMERAFGADFGRVRVHTGDQADLFNRSLQARAFTAGQDIFLRQGEYAPGSSRGQKLLAHELTHVLQQSRVPVGRMNMIMRSCRDHPDEDYYRNSENFCLDATFSPTTHSGKRCYREIPNRGSYFECPPGEHVCFDEEGNCEDSDDRAAPAEGKESDGTCNWNWWCVGAHTLKDFAPAIYEEYVVEPGARALRRLEQEMFRRMFPMPF